MKGDLSRPIILAWWALTVAWAALIFHLSTGMFTPDFSAALLATILHFLHLRVSPRDFNLLDACFRKLAHVSEYAILALFLYCRPGQTNSWYSRRALLCVVASAAYSLTDEFHQLYVPGRHASFLDCGLDTIGASLAMLLLYTLSRFPMSEVANQSRFER